jgi:AcrR family transcriptional regulator
MNRKVEQGEVTRARLIAVARSLFAERGFADSPTEEIVHRAEVTRGALYHHFRDKETLFRAVFEQIEGELAERVVVASAAASDPLQGIRLGLDAFLDACLEPAVQKIVLQEGPSVLGWDVWHEIDTRYAFGLLVVALDAAVDAGAIRRQPVEPLAHLLLGAVTQAGMVVARSETPEKTRAAIGKAFMQLLAGLRA